MKLVPRSVLGSLGSVLSPRKDKDKDVGKDAAAPSVPAIGNDVPTPSVLDVGKDIPTPSIPGIESDLPIPNVTKIDKDTPTPSLPGTDSTIDGNGTPSTVTTSITVSVTDTSTVTSAAVTITIIQHDLATVATTAPTTITAVQHDLATVAATVPTTIVTTKLAKPSTTQIAAAHTTAAPMPATSAVLTPTAKKHAEPAVVVSVVFGLMIMALLGLICFLALKLRRVAKTKPTVGMKTYAEEYDWPQQRPVELNDIERKDEWGPKQKEAWALA